MKKKYITTEKELIENFNLQILYEEIHKNKLTCKDIQEIYHICKRFMSKYNKEYNWGIKKSWKQQKKSYREKGIYKEDLYQLYIIEKKSLREIAREYNITHTQIKLALIFYNICEEKDIRPFNYSGYYENRKNNDEYKDKRIYREVMQKHLNSPSC